ncbi:MAG: LysM domain-containing protein [Chloroflexi bacterium]|nr:MAG: LysM domain-containing protein [Chloroflexota bacterium]
MPKRKQLVYQYGPGDNLPNLAKQNGVTEQEILQANPGGYPFDTGQNIFIPPSPTAFAQFGQNPPRELPRSVAGGYVLPPPAQLPRSVAGGYSLPVPAPTGIPNQFGQNTYFNSEKGYVSPGSMTAAQQWLLKNPGTPPGYGTDDSWYRPATTATTVGTQTAGGFPLAGNKPLKKGDFYGYERDPATGRSVRVVKNAATSDFLKELRWDPQSKKYKSIGSLLKSGKLDLKGNWHKGRGGGGVKKKVQRQQNFTLANSLISFGVGTG